MDKKILGRKINQIRKQNGLTSEQLSEMCEVNAVHIRQIEGGRKSPSLSLFIRICLALNTSPDYFLGHELKEINTPQNVNNLIYKLKHLSVNQINAINAIVDVIIDNF